MGLIAKDAGSGDWELAPSGTHTAICVQVIDKGTHYDEKWDTRKHKIMIGWELVGVKDSQGRPSLVFGHYTLTLAEKGNLRPMLESWRGKPFSDLELEGFDVFNVWGAPCLLSVIHNVVGKDTYANVSSVMALPNGTPKPTAESEMLKFDISDPDMATLEKFGDGLKKTITSADEWKAVGGRTNAELDAAAERDAPHDNPGSFTNDDIPF